jgi:hypothetical protein
MRRRASRSGVAAVPGNGECMLGEWVAKVASHLRGQRVSRILTEIVPPGTGA